MRAIVLTGEGPSFSAGLDRRMLTPEGVPGEESILSLAAHPGERMDRFIRQAQAAFAWWSGVPQVTLALVQGHAIGAGFQLALACDLMIVADDAKLAMRETSLGLVPDLGGTRPLVERVGYSRAFEICSTGRYVEADEAVTLGIATAKVPFEQWDIHVSAQRAQVRVMDSRFQGLPRDRADTFACSPTRSFHLAAPVARSVLRCSKA